jgi:hypothetical protein
MRILIFISFLLIHSFSLIAIDKSSFIEKNDTLAYKNNSLFRRSNPIFTRVVSPVSFDFKNYSDSKFHQVQLLGNALYSSNSITTSFANKIFQSSFLDFNSKANQFNKLNEKNKINFDFATGIEYAWKSDSSQFSHTFGIYQRSINQAEFTNALYYLTFFGNGNLEGREVDIAYNELTAMQLRQLQYATTYHVTKTLKFFAGASLLQGINYQRAKLSDATLKTDTLAEYIDLSYDLKYVRNSNKSNILSFNGIGFSFDAGCILTPDINTRIIFGFNDLSHITWNKNSELFAAKTAKHFEGLEIADLFSLTDTSFKNIDEDSILNYLGVANIKGIALDQIPFAIHGSYEYFSDRNFIYKISATYAPDLYWYPKLESSIGKYFNNILINVNAGSGGYERYFFGVSMLGNFQFNNSNIFNIYLSTSHLNALIFPNQATGFDASLGMSYKF